MIRLQPICAKCHKPIRDIFRPCPTCGYQHPLTEAGKEWALKKRLEEHGYSLHKITHFKHHDRVKFGNAKLNVSLNLRGKLSELALDTLIDACIGKKENP